MRRQRAGGGDGGMDSWGLLLARGKEEEEEGGQEQREEEEEDDDDVWRWKGKGGIKCCELRSVSPARSFLKCSPYMYQAGRTAVSSFSCLPFNPFSFPTPKSASPALVEFVYIGQLPVALMGDASNAAAGGGVRHGGA